MKAEFILNDCIKLEKKIISNFMYCFTPNRS